jgi:hypothetical protein
MSCGSTSPFRFSERRFITAYQKRWFSVHRKRSADLGSISCFFAKTGKEVREVRSRLIIKFVVLKDTS